MCTDGFLLLLQAAQILESPSSYCEISDSNSTASNISDGDLIEFRRKLNNLSTQLLIAKERLRGIQSSLWMNPKDTVPIGTGRTGIPKNVYYSINWSCYSHATRKLMTAVFCRTELATSSLTGKPSNAFGTTKPIKKILNPMKIKDIIEEVTLKCKVNRSLVRTAITTKCAEESRRHRLNGKRSPFINMKI